MQRRAFAPVKPVASTTSDAPSVTVSRPERFTVPKPLSSATRRRTDAVLLESTRSVPVNVPPGPTSSVPSPSPPRTTVLETVKLQGLVLSAAATVIPPTDSVPV